MKVLLMGQSDRAVLERPLLDQADTARIATQFRPRTGKEHGSLEHITSRGDNNSPFMASNEHRSTWGNAFAGWLHW